MQFGILPAIDVAASIGDRLAMDAAVEAVVTGEQLGCGQRKEDGNEEAHRERVVGQESLFGGTGFPIASLTRKSMWADVLF